MVVNVTGYTLFVTSQYDVILTFRVVLATFVDTACILFYTPVLPTLLFSREFGLVFSWICVFF